METLKLGEVVALASVVNALLRVGVDEQNQVINRRMPFKLRHRLLKAEALFKPEVVPYEEERLALIKELGEPVEEGSQQLRVTEENHEEFFKRLSEVLDTEVSIELGPVKLTEDDLDLIEGDVQVQDGEVELFTKLLLVE